MRSRFKCSLTRAAGRAFAALLAIGSVCVGEDKGVLGDDLADLQKAVDALPATGGATDPAKPTTKPADASRPPTTASGDHGKKGILGDDLADLEQSIGELRPPRASGQPPINPATQPLGQVLPGSGEGNLRSEQWVLKAGRGEASIKSGELTLAAAGASGSASATFRTPLSGDFELRVEFALAPRPPANKAPLSRGLGLRIESTGGWKAARLLSIDRTSDEKGDLILAAESDQLKPALEARPKGSACTVRVQRQGDRFRIAYREENAKEWANLGEIEAEMSPKLELWLTAYVVGGDIRAAVKQIELQPLSR